MLTTVTEYARRLGLHPDTVRQKILRGNLPAQKVGGVWLIDENTPYIDHRTAGDKQGDKNPERPEK